MVEFFPSFFRVFNRVMRRCVKINKHQNQIKKIYNKSWVFFFDFSYVSLHLVYYYILFTAHFLDFKNVYLGISINAVGNSCAIYRKFDLFCNFEIPHLHKSILNIKCEKKIKLFQLCNKSKKE